METQGNMTNVGRLRRGLMPLILLVVAGLATFDLFEDFEEGTSLGHVALEGIIVASGLLGLALEGKNIVAVLRRAESAENANALLHANAAALHADAARWRAESEKLLHGLSHAIDNQLERWTLSPAEKDIALLLLKGLSHKAIAELRGVGEATVRQQSRSIYKKAGLEGRHDLAAFFLEDLLVARERS